MRALSIETRKSLPMAIVGTVMTGLAASSASRPS